MDITDDVGKPRATGYKGQLIATGASSYGGKLGTPVTRVTFRGALDVDELPDEFVSLVDEYDLEITNHKTKEAKYSNRGMTVVDIREP